MKTKFKYLIAAAVILMTAACRDEAKLVITVSETTFLFDAAGDERIIEVTSNVAWNITGQEQWQPVSPTRGDKGTVEVTVKAKPNTTAEPRKSVFKITSATGSPFVEVKVDQKAASVVSIGDIKGVTRPVAGGNPVDKITATPQYTGEVAWQEATVNGVFTYERAYTAVITLTAEDGYTFSGVKNIFTVAGAEVEYEAGSNVIKAKFPPTAKKITLTGITDVTAPATGETSVKTFTTDEYAGKVMWEPNHAFFAPLLQYKATITIEPEDGYTLWGATFTVAGASDVTHAEGSDVIKATFPTTSEAPPPVLSGTVTISGAATFDATLTAETGALTSSPAGTTPSGFTYQWERGGTNIGGATAKTYKLVQADINQPITVTVKADNCTGSRTSAATAPVAKAAQTAPAAPTLKSAATNVITLNDVTGAQYRLGTNTWQDSPVFEGLTANTQYSFTQRLKETDTHLASAASAAASFSTEEAPTPALSGTVTISGAATFDYTLSAVTTALTSSPAGTTPSGFTYQWKRNGTNISGATASTYKLVQADIGQPITVTVTAGNCTGNVTSTATAPVAKATQTAAPAAPTMDSRTDKSIALNTVNGAEYRYGTNAWQNTPDFTGLTANTSYSFTQRWPETATYLASDPGQAASFTTARTPTIAVTSNGLGSLKVGQAVSANIVYTLSNSTYATAITAADFRPSNLPAGLNVGTTTRTSATVVTVAINGTPTAYNASATTVTRPPNIPKVNVNETFDDVAVSGAAITAGAVERGDGASVSQPVVNGAPQQTIISVSAVSLTPNTGQAREYAITTSTSTTAPASGWQSGTAFSGLNIATTYYVWARSVANINYNAGTAVRSDAITTLKGDGASVVSAPVVSGTPTHESITVGAVTLTPATGQSAEYAIYTSSTTAPVIGWVSGTTFSGLNSNTMYYVWARSAANNNYNAGTAVRSAAINTAAWYIGIWEGVRNTITVSVAFTSTGFSIAQSFRGTYTFNEISNQINLTITHTYSGDPRLPWTQLANPENGTVTYTRSGDQWIVTAASGSNFAVGLNGFTFNRQ